MKSLIFSLSIVCFLVPLTTVAQEMPPIEKGVSQKLAKWRAANYSDVRYKLNLTIEKKAPTMRGTIEIRVKVSVPSALADAENVSAGNVNRKNSTSRTPANAGDTDIIVDWRKIKGHEKLSKISNVSVNGKTAKYEEINEHLVFKEGVKSGENVIKLDFESPILTSGSAITRYIDKEDGAEYIYSLFVPSDASTAFPVFDQPDLKARFSLQVTTSNDWQVISNYPTKNRVENGINTKTNEDTNPIKIGRAVLPKNHKENSRKGLLTRKFEETKPISTYVFAIAAGEFHYSSFFDINEEDVPTTIYYRKSQRKKMYDHLGDVYGLHGESIKYFEDYFDYKFPFPKYDLVLIPEFPFGGMEHAGATFLRESSIIFPTEPTANNYISRASLLFHENAHQWFGDTVTMKWFDDLWLKEGFATFMAYKAMEKVMPEYDVWKVFYERTKQRAYLTDVTKGTTPIYQEIPNLNSAKSAYGNIVYQKAPSFLKQAEFYLGEKDFQTAVRSFLKKHEFKNAEWSDLVKSFEEASKRDLKEFANVWVKQRGLPKFSIGKGNLHSYQELGQPHDTAVIYTLNQKDVLNENGAWLMKTKILIRKKNGIQEIKEVSVHKHSRRRKFGFAKYWLDIQSNTNFEPNLPVFVFPNYQDYGYGIFLLDEKSKKYILENIQNEKDDFLRSMMWGSLWDSVRFNELDPKDYVELAIKNIDVEKDVSTISSILGRVSNAMTYYIKSVPSALADAESSSVGNVARKSSNSRTPAHAGGTDISAMQTRLENLLINKMQTAKTQGERITFYRSFLGIASSKSARQLLKDILNEKSKIKGFKLRTRDKFNIVTRLIVLVDKDAPKLLAELEKTEKGDAAKRYAYAAKAGFATKANKAKYWNDFVNNKDISESWIEAAFGVWNSPGHSDLTLPYLEKALAELPNHKQNRKIFFVNGWTASFIGGQKSEEALNTVNKFLKDNPKLDIDLQRKILERLDGLERAVKIRKKYGE